MFFLDINHTDHEKRKKDIKSSLNNTSMKYCILYYLLFFSIHTNAQDFGPKNNLSGVTPNMYNSFVIDPAISWAGYFEAHYSFLNTPVKGCSSIYDYLAQQQSSGMIKTYKGIYPGDDNYVEVPPVKQGTY